MIQIRRIIGSIIPNQRLTDSVSQVPPLIDTMIQIQRLTGVSIQIQKLIDSLIHLQKLTDSVSQVPMLIYTMIQIQRIMIQI